MSIKPDTSIFELKNNDKNLTSLDSEVYRLNKDIFDHKGNTMFKPTLGSLL